MTVKVKKHSPHDYVFQQELGNGSYSTVYKVVDKRNPKKLYAIKVCSKKHIIKENKVKYVTIEKNVLNILGERNHPGIVRLFYTFHDEKNLYFLLSYAVNGELLCLLHKNKTFSMELSLYYTVQIIDILEYIHSCGIIHRDLKPENILLDGKFNLQLTDFGAATVVNSDVNNNASTAADVCLRSSSFVGTAEYVSPELLLHNECGFGSDIWALGCIIYQFFIGQPPFKGANELKTFEKIVGLDYNWSTNTMSNSINTNDSMKLAMTTVRNLVSKILVIEPAKRMSLQQIKNHVWFQSIAWNNKPSLWSSPPFHTLQQHSALKNINHKNNSKINDRQLHVIDTPLKSIPITKHRKKQKPSKISNNTNSIVEWRKNLGISLSTIPSSNLKDLGFPPSTNLNGNKVPNHINSNIPITIIPNVSQPRASTPNNKNLAYNDILQQSNIVKQQFVYLRELSYNDKGPVMSLKSYNKIDDKIIREFVSGNKMKLVSSDSSIPQLLTLKQDGSTFYSTFENGVYITRPENMLHIEDSNLSMYDFELDESKLQGFLILEKFHSKLWFISLAPPDSVPQSISVLYSNINDKKSWVESFINLRNSIENQQVMTTLLESVSLEDKPVGTQKKLNTQGSSVISTASINGYNTSVMTEPTLQSSYSDGLMESSQSSSSMSPRSVTRQPPSKPPPMTPTQKADSTRLNTPKLQVSTSITRPVAPKQTAKKFYAPPNMVISSSRYEVLKAIQKNESPIDPSYYKDNEHFSMSKNSSPTAEPPRHRNIDASIGALAAFKNRQGKK